MYTYSNSQKILQPNPLIPRMMLENSPREWTSFNFYSKIVTKYLEL